MSLPLESREPGDAAPGAAAGEATWRWREPTRRIPLLWGGWASRSAIGLVAVASGAGVIAVGGELATPEVPALAALRWIAVPTGLALGVAGWLLLPAVGWRRLLVALPAAAAPVLLAAGPWGALALIAPLLAWLVVRQRPLQTLATATLPLATTIVIARIESRPDPLLPGWIDLLIVLASVVAAAVVARAVHVGRDRRRRHLARRRHERAVAARLVAGPEA